MPKLVRASVEGDQISKQLLRLTRRIERLEQKLTQRVEKGPVQPKQIENNTVLRIKKLIKNHPKGIHGLDIHDYKFYLENRRKF